MENMQNETLVSLTNEQISELRYNSPIPTDSWKAIDSMIIDSAQKTLNAGNDLMSMGLTTPIDVGTKVSVVDVSAERDAAVEMEIESSGGYGKSPTKSQSFAIPVVKARANIGVRDIDAVQRAGGNLPDLQIRQGINACMKSLEQLIFNGEAGINLGGVKALGLTNTTAKKEVTITNAWGTNTANVISDFEKMYAAMLENGYSVGPYILYVPVGAYAKMSSDYKTESNLSFIQRIQSYAGVFAVRPTSYLTGKKNVLVNMNVETIDLAVARDITAVPLQNDIARGTEIFVYGVMGLRVKSSYGGESGVIVTK